ncbi:MAG: hypothetical protein JWQ02_1497 [Capsulimonas sp.]|jgi:hypothetical protein|nr:hypothetical protein [Capsulimonas sp.]
MASESIRCSDCNAPFRAVPLWLLNAKVNFSCTSCPKRGGRSTVRFEPAIEPVVTARKAVDLDADPDLEGIDLEEIDEDIDMDLGDDDADGKDDKDI